MVAPLVKVTTIEPFQWTSSAQEAFDNLKLALSIAPVLALPNSDIPFTIESDAFGMGMGAVLAQNGHPMSCLSKPLSPKLRCSSTYVRELCVITTAVKKWRQYLLGHRFMIIIDHRSLKELLTQVIQTPELHMYLARLMLYDYDIQYRSRANNQAANALSRLPEMPATLHLILSVPSLTFLGELRHQLNSNASYCHQR